MSDKLTFTNRAGKVTLVTKLWYVPVLKIVPGRLQYIGTILPEIFCIISGILCDRYRDMLFFSKEHDHTFRKRRTLVQSSKKLGCPAKVFMSRVIKFPQYKVCNRIYNTY